MTVAPGILGAGRGAPASVAEDDLALARRIAAGERAAFELLMRRYNRRLYRVARAALRDDAEAKDALQDCYLAAYRSVAHFRGESSLATWLSRLVLNECAARLRRSARRANIVPMVSADHHQQAVAGVADQAEAPEHFVARTQLRAVLERKVVELPEAFRVVFVLRSLEELTFEEIAAILQVPAETARSRFFRARGLLRESLARDIDLAEANLFDFGGAHCDGVVASVLARLKAGAT
jgi:RNA polymerase sigma-70 factor (ECF subfamily)